MTEEAQKAKIAEACGVKPFLECWSAYKDDGDGGSFCMSGDTKQEVEDWLARLPEGSWAKEYHPKALYRYPDYRNSVEDRLKAWHTLADDERRLMRQKILAIAIREGIWEEEAWFSHWMEAFLLTCDLWEATPNKVGLMPE